MAMSFVMTGAASTFSGTTTTATLCHTVTGVTNCRRVVGELTVGYIGCSDTWMSVTGYYMFPNAALFWPSDARYSGGGIDSAGWANASTYYWAEYELEVSSFGQPKAIWVEDCGSNSTNPWSDVLQFFTILNQVSPGVPVYMSSISNFLPNGTCPRAGLTGVPQTENMTKMAIAKGLALAGPIMGPLGPTTLDSSRCHPNTAGELLLGAQLVKFFDPSPTSTSTSTTSKTDTSRSTTTSSSSVSSTTTTSIASSTTSKTSTKTSSSTTSTSTTSSSASTSTLNPTISISPSGGAAGTTVVVSGSGFTPGSQVQLYVSGSVNRVASITSSKSGTFSVSGAASGSLSAYALDVKSGTYSNTVTFTVVTT